MMKSNTLNPRYSIDFMIDHRFTQSITFCTYGPVLLRSATKLDEGARVFCLMC